MHYLAFVGVKSVRLYQYQDLGRAIMAATDDELLEAASWIFSPAVSKSVTMLQAVHH
jgi:hypothetical protein